MPDHVKLAELVAEHTATRMNEMFKEELGSFRDQWLKDMAKLRDDLTVRGLLNSEACGLDCPLKETLIAGAKGSKVLVVDDYPQVRKVLARLLTEAGIVALEADGSPAAMEILKTTPDIAVVLADITMPSNGYTLLEYVRAHYPAIEVVMVSGYDAEVDRARELGAFGFLAKPFTAAQAVLVIERAIENRRLKATAASVVANAPARPEDAPTK